MKTGRRRLLGGLAGILTGGLFARGARASAAGLTFEIYQDARKEHRWRLKAANGQVIATSGQGYKAKADCRHEIEVIQKEAAGAKIEEAAAEK